MARTVSRTAAAARAPTVACVRSFSASVQARSADLHEETFEEFTARYVPSARSAEQFCSVGCRAVIPRLKDQSADRRVSCRYEKEFDQVQDVFELQVWFNGTNGRLAELVWEWWS